jgi:aminoglycoside 6'-N-acetyltransferase I
MQIIDLSPDDKSAIEQVAMLLIEGFAEHSPDAWPDRDSALDEVRQSFGADCISRIALYDDGTVLGWIGGRSSYDGNVWELHPLVVDIHYQNQGIGRELVRDFEEIAKERGGSTVFLGTDDENYQTTLSGINLYPNVFEYIAHIRNLNHHPYEFYLKCGYAIVGVIPDANGPGKPDILMAKAI